MPCENVRMARAVLWDMDGTLVDSEDYHWLAWRDTMASEGFAITHAQFLATFGQRNDSILPQWLGSDASADRIQQVGDAKEELYRKLVRERGLAALPGAVDWVRRLGRESWRQAVASSAPRANLDVVLEVIGLAPEFQAVVSAEDVTAGKPDPQVFLKAAERLGLPPGRCIVVEDAAMGVEAARRAGMRCIGVNRNGGLKADVVVRSLLDLAPDVFNRLSRG
jgi:beta-phosphoglucomutase family hydrolase